MIFSCMSFNNPWDYTGYVSINRKCSHKFEHKEMRQSMCLMWKVLCIQHHCFKGDYLAKDCAKLLTYEVVTWYSWKTSHGTQKYHKCCSLEYMEGMLELVFEGSSCQLHPYVFTKC